MAIQISEDKALFLINEQFTTLRQDMQRTHDAYSDLLEKVSSQSVLLASLAERIDAHNRLLEERKKTDHTRIGDLEDECVALKERVEDLERFRWKLAGATAVLVLLSDMIINQWLK